MQSLNILTLWQLHYSIKSELLFNYHKAKSFARNYEMIVVEGYMDVISANAMGFANTVGIMGTALTKEQIELLKEIKV